MECVSSQTAAGNIDVSPDLTLFDPRSHVLIFSIHLSSPVTPTLGQLASLETKENIPFALDDFVF